MQLNFFILLKVSKIVLYSYLYLLLLTNVCGCTDSNPSLIEYTGFKVSYNASGKIPNWVLYELTASETEGPYSRKGKDFQPDPGLSLPQANDGDYRRSGWSESYVTFVTNVTYVTYVRNVKQEMAIGGDATRHSFPPFCHSCSSLQKIQQF